MIGLGLVGLGVFGYCFSMVLFPGYVLVYGVIYKRVSPYYGMQYCPLHDVLLF